MNRNDNAATNASTEITSWLDENELVCPADGVPARVVEEDIRRALNDRPLDIDAERVCLTNDRLDVEVDIPLSEGYRDDDIKALRDAARDGFDLVLVAEDDESDQQAAIDLLAETLDDVLDKEWQWTPEPVEPVDDETRDNVHRALERAQANAIVDWGPDEAAYADDDWMVVPNDRDTFKDDIRDDEVPEWADIEVVVNWMQTAHDYAADKVSGDPSISGCMDVFVAARTADEAGDEDEPVVMTDGGMDVAEDTATGNTFEHYDRLRNEVSALVHSGDYISARGVSSCDPRFEDDDAALTVTVQAFGTEEAAIDARDYLVEALQDSTAEYDNVEVTSAGVFQSGDHYHKQKWYVRFEVSQENFGEGDEPELVTDGGEETMKATRKDIWNIATRVA